MKLSASIFSASRDQRDYLLTQLLEYSVDMCHIDCTDDMSVFDDIISIQRRTDIPIDLHIISPDPLPFIERAEALRVHQVSIQIEPLTQDIDLSEIKKKELNIGIAIQIQNHLLSSIIETYIEHIDFVLLMTTTPGVSGGQFDHNHLKIIRDTMARYPQLKYQIDGGINHEIAYALRIFGVDSIVIGSYLVNHSSIGAAVLSLRTQNIGSELKVSDIMIPYHSLPIVADPNAKIKDVLGLMQDYRLGVVFCVFDHKFVGIITNADFRRYIIEKGFIEPTQINELINTTPKVIVETFTVKKMLDYLSNVDFPILVLPVLDTQMKNLLGAVSFHNLLKSN